MLTASSLVAAALLGAVIGLALERFAALLSDGLPTLGRRAAFSAVLAGAVAPLLALSAESKAQLVPAAALLCVLFIAALTDLETRRIPNRLTGGGLLAMIALTALFEPGFATERFLFALLVFAFFLAAALARPGGLGLGDVKLVAVIGAALGAASIVAIGFALLISALVGAAIALARGWRHARAVALPLAPFLAAGSALTLLFGG